MCELAQALQICEQWAIDFAMKWALSKDDSQILLSRERATRYRSFPFAEEHIQIASEARYTGVQITSGPVGECGKWLI